MTQQNASPFDLNSLGANLALTVRNTQLRTSAQSVDAHRAARSQYGLGGTTDEGKVEFYIWSPNGSNPSLAPVSGVPPLTVGLMKATAVLNKYVGEGADSWGFSPGDGKLYNNGAVVATFSAVTLRSTIGMIWDATNLTLTFKNGPTVIGSFVLPSAPYWYGATVSGTNPDDLAIWANPGLWPMRYPDGVPGWLHVGIGITPTFIANIPFVAAATDPRPNQRYAGDLDRANQPMRVARSSDFWFWGQSKPPQLGSQAQIALQINDPDKIYDWLMTADIRDQSLIIRRGSTTSTVALADAIYTAIIDRCEQPEDRKKILYAGSKLAQLQAQLFRPQYLPDDDSSVAGKPWSLILGVGRNFAGPMFDATNFYFTGSCLPIAAVGKARDQGVELGYGIDFGVLPDGKNLSRVSAPVGHSTFEITTYGGSFNAAFTDLLGGDGVFASVATDGDGVTGSSTTSFAIGTGSKAFSVHVGLNFVIGSKIIVTSTGSGATMTGTVTAFNSGAGTVTVNVTSTTGSGTHTDWSLAGGVGQPHNWLAGGGYPLDDRTTIFQIKGSVGSQYVEQLQTAAADYWAQHATMTVAPGAAVAFEVVVAEAPFYGNAVDGLGNPIVIPPGQLVFGGLASHELQFFPWAKFSTPNATTYRGSFVNNQSVTLPLVFGMLCNNFIQGTGGVTSRWKFTSIKVVPLPALTQNTQLGQPGLDQMLRDLLVTFGPLTLDDYDSSGAVAIDAANKYGYSLHVGENETPQVLDLVKAVCDSTGASPIETRTGKIGVFQLTPPELATSTQGTLTETNFNGYLEPWPDYAENLTARGQCTQNIDPYTTSDFAGVSTTLVPQSVRNLLMAKFQSNAIAGVPLPTRYATASQADPKTFAMDLLTHMQAELTRVNSLYSVPRNFYVGQLFAPLGTLYDIGQVWRVVYPTGNLTAGQNLVIVHVEDMPTEELCEVVFWGL